MNLAALGKAIADIAPFLGKILPIPGGEIIGEIIAHEFGGNLSDQSDLISKISKEPNARIKLEEIQSNCKVQLQQLAVQQSIANLQTSTKDIQDARTQNAKSNMPRNLTFLIVFIFFASFVLLIFLGNSIPEKIDSILYMMLGTISTAFGSAFAYWLGTSASSQAKDIAIHNTLANLSSGS